MARSLWLAFQSVRNDLKSLKNVICLSNTPKGMIDYEALLASGSDAEPDVMDSIKPQDILVLQYTGGTTGTPKAPMHTHDTWVRMAYDLNRELMDTSGNDVMMHVAPLTAASSAFLLGETIEGVTQILLRKFNPEEVFETIQKYRVTQTMLIPTMVQMLLYHPSIRRYDLSSLKTCAYGASPFPQEHLKAAVSYFGNIFTQYYGMSEAMIPVLTLRKSEHILEGTPAEIARLGSAGRCNIPIQVEVVNGNDKPVKPGEVGEIRIKGYMVMQGYWHRTRETKEKLRNGWMYSGDMATVDEEGYVFIVDRKDYMIISGGFNVYPKEVEDFISTHPAVLHVCVFGVPHEKWGETVKAVVSLKEGFTVSEQDIINFCREGGLAGYKRPTSIDFLSELPLTAVGKIDKKALKNPFWMKKQKNVN